MPYKKWYISLLAPLAACLMLMLFSIPAQAVSDNVQQVLTRLEALQNSHIDPAWEPDVKANQSSVEGLLAAYQGCTLSQRKEFTLQQNQQLRSYFTTLYKVQGKDTAEVAALFTGVSPASSQVSSSSPASSASSAASSSKAPSSESKASSSVISSSRALQSSSVSSSSAASSKASSALPSSSAPLSGSSSALPVSSSLSSSSKAVTPASVTSSSGSSLPSALFLPQIPKNNSLFSFMGNPGLANLFLLLLSALSLLVFFRYLGALKSLKKSKQNTPEEEWEETLLTKEELRRSYGYETPSQPSAPFPEAPSPPTPPSVSKPIPLSSLLEVEEKTNREKAFTAQAIHSTIENQPSASGPAHQPTPPPSPLKEPSGPSLSSPSRVPGAPRPAPAPKNKRTGRPSKMSFIPQNTDELDWIDD